MLPQYPAVHAPARLAQHGEAPLTGARLQTRVDEEEDDLQPYPAVAEGLGRARVQYAGAAGGTVVLPGATSSRECERHRAEGTREQDIPDLVGGAVRQHRRHHRRPRRGADAPAGVQPVHVAHRDVPGSPTIQRRIDGARPEPDHRSHRHELRPARRGSITEEPDGDESAARGEEAADAEPNDDAPGEDARHRVSGDAHGQDGAESRLRETEAIANRRPGHPDDGVGKAERDEREVRERQQRKGRGFQVGPWKSVRIQRRIASGRQDFDAATLTGVPRARTDAISRIVAFTSRRAVV